MATAALAVTVLASFLASVFDNLAEDFFENCFAVPVAEDLFQIGILLIFLFLVLVLFIAIFLDCLLDGLELALNQLSIIRHHECGK